MSVVQISYQFSSYREKVEPGSDLNDVLHRSLSHFKLHSDKNWTLQHHDKPLPLTVPIRLLNLAKGATLVLKESQVANSKGNQLKIKFVVPSFGTEIWAGYSKSKILEAVEDVFGRNSWSLDPQSVRFQCFAKIWTYDQIRDTTFEQLGIAEDVAIRVSMANTSKKVSNNAEDSKHLEAPTDVTDLPTPQAVESRAKGDQTPRCENVRDSVLAYIPSTNSIPKDLGVEDDFNVTVNQFKKYQKMLSKSAGGDQPLLTKRLREEKAPKTMIENCNVRVRFPDRSCIDINFKPDDTILLVYEAVSRCLSDKALQFRLFHSHPHQEIKNTEAKLVADLGFGSKTLLIFESDYRASYLRSDLLEKAKSMADSKRADEAEQTRTAAGGNGSATEAEKKPTTGLRAGHKPKWLKLGKK
ncbi:LADA_0H19746g1_1 [Lachancea dasiensis]|uniref:LADA_0H19746g1_1 n=1 Tax=Lachancea dasiensis TaxID=1072105 RepID=A0A1G4K6I0_9SACH|nr:LADA_0H19746g1_1 [Lachancea dasiensis]